jgi:hypothetical protein
MFDRTFGGVLRWLITALSQRRGDFGSGAVTVFALALLPRSRRAYRPGRIGFLDGGGVVKDHGAEPVS